MKTSSIAITLFVGVKVLAAAAQASTNEVSGATPTSAPPVNIQLSLPGAVEVTNILTFKPDEETQKLLRNASATFAARPISIQLDGQSVTQLTQLLAKPVTIDMAGSTLARLEPRPEALWKNVIPLVSTLIGAGIAFFASYWATTYSHTLHVKRERQMNADVAQKFLKAIEAELDGLSEIFNQGIGKELKAKTGRMFLTRLALSQDYFTVYGANAGHLVKLEPALARAIITLYLTLKALIEGFRINNEYVQMYDAVLYQLTTSFPTRPDGVRGRAAEIEELLRQQGDDLVRLAQDLEAQYAALKQLLGNPVKAPQTVKTTTSPVAQDATTEQPGQPA